MRPPMELHSVAFFFLGRAANSPSRPAPILACTRAQAEPLNNWISTSPEPDAYCTLLYTRRHFPWLHHERQCGARPNPPQHGARPHNPPGFLLSSSEPPEISKASPRCLLVTGHSPPLRRSLRESRACLGRDSSSSLSGCLLPSLFVYIFGC